MTVDFLLFRTPHPIREAADLTDDRLEALGPRDQVRAMLDTAMPGITWTTSSGHGRLDGEALELCVLVGAEQVEYLCVRAGADASGAVRQLADALGLVAFDSQRGVVLNPTARPD